MRVYQSIIACGRVVPAFAALLLALSVLVGVYPQVASAGRSDPLSIQSLDHAPASFDVEVQFNGSSTETLTLFNNGTTNLDFTVRASRDELSVVVLSPDQNPPTGIVTDLNAFPGITAELYTGDLNELTGADLIPYDVAILNNEESWGWPDGNVIVGDALADFIDANGKAVVFNNSYASEAYASHLDGRFITENYGPVQRSPDNAVLLYADMDVEESGHPILSGVGTVKSSGGRVFDNPVQPGATVVAVWGFSRSAISANDDVVAFNMFYPDFAEGDFSGDIELMTYNAVMFFELMGWLGFGTESGTVPAGGQVDIDVHFDAAGLAGGVYEGDIVVEAGSGSLTIPATLTVVDQRPWLEGTVTSLGFCSLDPHPLEGVQIEIVGSQSGSYQVTTDSSGFYRLRIEAAESPLDINISAANHEDFHAAGVVLAPEGTTVMDFDLVMQGCASHTPQSFDIELFVGESGTETLTLYNSGDTALDFSLAANPPQVSVVVLTADWPMPTNLVADLNSFPGISAEMYPGNLGNLDVITGTDLAGYDVAVLNNTGSWAHYGGNISVGNALADFVDAGGKVVVFNGSYVNQGDDSRLDGRFMDEDYGPFLPISGPWSGSWNMVPLEPDHTILGGVGAVGTSHWILYVSMQPGAELIAEWDNGRPMIAANEDVVAINLYYSYLDQPTSWTGNVDRLAYNAVMHFQSVGWLNLDPENGTVPVGETFNIDVHFDSDGLDVGVYQANLLLDLSDSLGPVGTVTVPVSLTVAEPATIAGTVTSLGHCSDDLSALEGAQAELVSQSGSYSTVTGPGGSYQFEIDAAESPVTISVTATDHLGDSESGVALVPFDTVVVDFDLALDAACATVAPDDVAFTLYPGESDAASLEIGNVNGAGVLDWTVFSAEIMASDPRAHFPAVPYVAEPADRSGSSAAADMGQKSLHGPVEAGGLLDATVPVYTTTSWNAPGYITLDALVPGPYTVINATQPTNVFAAAFIDNDFSTHYGVASTGGDLPLNSFIAIDTATGTFETLGTVSDGPTGGFNSMKWDHITSTLYAASRDSLYTIDLDTLQADLVGSFGVQSILMIAIAISPEGLMYGLDIANDVLLAIDKTTGEAAAIGPLGLDANFAQDMDFDQSDGTLYWGGYFGSGDSQVLTIDTTTGAATSIGPVQGGSELLTFSIALPGQTGCFSAVDIEWLEVAPVSGSTAAGSSDLVTVSVNASGLAPGLYEADVCVSTNDPVHSLMTVPVSLLVEVPPAVVSGTVRGLGYCSADPAGLAGALVEAQGSDGGSFSVTTDGSGFYQFEVFAEDSPLTISTGFDGHNDASITVEFEPGEQVNGDLDLLLSIPCAAVLPESLSINLDAGSSLTGQIEVSNATGGAPLVWNIDSAEVSGDDDAVRLVQCDDPEGFSWLKFSPMFGVTPAGTASHINVTLDAGSLQPGQYQAGLCIASNDAHHTLQSVPINLNVRTPGTWGDGLDGTVQSLGYCGDNPAPLEGATVTVVGTGFSEPTDADGYFSFALDPDQGPYELTVTHPDHLPASESGINPPATVDFDLALDAACATVDPEAIVGSALTGGTDLQTLTISNHGAADLNWTIDEALPAALPPTQLQLSMGLPATGSYTLLGGMASGRVDTGNLLDLGPFQMSQTTDTNIEPANSVGCPTGPNHLLRRFYYDEHPGVGNGIESVDVAVQEAADTTSLTVNLYTLASSTPVDTIPVGDLVLIGTAMASISAGDDGTIVNVPVIGVVDDMSANDLVVEVVANQSFFVGATSSGETHPGFVMASACGITSPTPVRDVGPDFVNTHIIMVVNATPGSGCTAPEDVPWLSTSPTSGTVAGGDSATVDVMLDASNLSPGVYEAELCVNSNDAANPLIPVPVSLEVLDLDPAELGVDPAVLDFGTVPVGDEVTQSFSVSNRAEVGSAALVLTGLDVSGDAGFSLSGGDCALNTELEPGDSCLVEISFTPGAEAVFEAEVTIAANAQQATVALSGTGHAEPSADLIFSDRFEEVDADDEG